MNPHLDMRELPDRLEFHVTHRPSQAALMLRMSLWILAFVAPIGMAKEAPIMSVITGCLFLYMAINDTKSARRGTDVYLLITERDIVSDGYTHHEYHPLNRWRTQAPDLAWREKHSPEDGPTYPQGVYCGEDCVLPLVTMEQGHSIITAIYSRYPDTAAESRYDTSSVHSPIITLGLADD